MSNKREQNKLFPRLLHSTMVLSLFIIINALIFPVSAYGASLDELQQQKNIAQQKANELKQQAKTKASTVADLTIALQVIAKQIANEQGRINNTQKNISSNEKAIAKTELEIQEKQAQLEINMAKQTEAIQTMYVVGRQSTIETLISSNSLSEAMARKQYLTALSDKIESMMREIKKLKADLEAKKVSLEQRRIELSAQKEQQVAAQQDLLNQKQKQSQLLGDTQSALAALNKQIKDAQNEAAAAQARINALSATKNWGDGIVSDNDSSWYYTQTGNYTHLGNTSLTVNSSGCLVTSVAMVATYYGKRITPNMIANNDSLFTSGGGLTYTLPASYGITVAGGVPVNWGTVNDEISRGHPVIISLYMPSIGVNNSDGSSHFIVIKGRSGDKYLMHDPIGDGRSYSLNQVRSMKIVRPL